MFSKAEIEKYFTAEKQGSLLFLVIGVVAIILELVFYLGLKTSFYKGAAIPILACCVELLAILFVQEVMLTVPVLCMLSI